AVRVTVPGGLAPARGATNRAHGWSVASRARACQVASAFRSAGAGATPDRRGAGPGPPPADGRYPRLRLPLPGLHQRPAPPLVFPVVLAQLVAMALVVLAMLGVVLLAVLGEPPALVIASARPAPRVGASPPEGGDRFRRLARATSLRAGHTGS